MRPRPFLHAGPILVGASLLSVSQVARGEIDAFGTSESRLARVQQVESGPAVLPRPRPVVSTVGDLVAADSQGGECSQDGDCSDPYRPICDPDNLICMPCAADNGEDVLFACPSEAAPVCQKTGDLAGACTECSATETLLCSNDKPICLEDIGTCGCLIDEDCPASGWHCSGSICVSRREKVWVTGGGGLGCSAAGASWTASGVALAALLLFAGRRPRVSRRVAP